MRNKIRAAITPYSFRARTQMVLAFSIVIAAVISLMGAYIYTRYVMQAQISKDEYAAAVDILSLRQNTDLSMEQIMEMVGGEGLQLRQIDLPGSFLTSADLDQLEDRTILAVVGSNSTQPMTFVKTADGIVGIFSTDQASLIASNFTRTAFFGVIFSAVFALISMLSTWRITRPVTQLTEATRKISKGDFDIDLPKDQQDEMGELMRSFDHMTDELRRTSTQQKDFIASVSHEFRTPIASIKGYAKLLQMPGLDDEQRQDYLNMITQESDRLSRLSETLLRLSALEQQADPASLSSLRVDESIRQIILRMEPVWSARSITFDLDMDEVTIESDRDLLDQVWSNIIQNAMKFSADGSAIEIGVHMDDRAQISFIDHGIGMDRETIDRIFERFYQADRSRSRTGVGLGMSLVKRILDILDGEIGISSEPGKGTTVVVTLPKRYQSHHAKAAEESAKG